MRRLIPRIMIAIAALWLLPFLAGTAVAGVSDPTYRGQPNSVWALFQDPNLNGNWGLTSWDSVNGGFPLDPNHRPPTVVRHPNNGGVVIEMPNFIDPLPMKLMRIQIRCDGCTTVTSNNILIEAFDPLSTAVQLHQEVSVSGNDKYFDYWIMPNPDWERITLAGITGNVFSVEIDTISQVPIPAALPLFSTAIAGLGFVGWRKRKAA